MTRRETATGARRALALSPHLDDAAFSAGGMLARLAQDGWEVVVATIFTASVSAPTGFALACQLDKGLPPEVDYMALRRAEDEAACAALGARALHLPLREAPHRGYESAAALFQPPLRDDPAEAAIRAAVAPLLRDRAPDLLLLPQAIGGHVDHVQLVRAVLTLAPSMPVLWWRDFPYVNRLDTPRRPFEDLLSVFPEVAPPTDPGAKHAACAAYATQIGFQFGGAEGLSRALAVTGGREVARLQGSMP